MESSYIVNIVQRLV